MTDSDGGNWLDKLAAGGLPQILAGPAGAAISRLIGAVVEIPASLIDGVAEGIKDKTKARSHLTQAIAEKAAKIAVDNPAIMDRAINTLLWRTYRVQENKDAVAQIAVESLIDEPPPHDSAGPSEDWMMKFERYAEDASSADLRTMFGKLLAGEVRKPGAVAPNTLHFVSMLERDTAQLIQRVLPHTSDRGLTFIECVKPALTIVEIAYIEQSGFWTSEKSINLKFSNDGVVIEIVRGNMGYAVRSKANTAISRPAAILSRAGRDLLAIAGGPFDFQSLANVVLSNGAENFFFGEVTTVGPERSILNANELLNQSESQS